MPHVPAGAELIDRGDVHAKVEGGDTYVLENGALPAKEGEVLQRIDAPNLALDAADVAPQAAKAWEFGEDRMR